MWRLAQLSRDAIAVAAWIASVLAAGTVGGWECEDGAEDSVAMDVLDGRGSRISMAHDCDARLMGWYQLSDAEAACGRMTG